MRGKSEGIKEKSARADTNSAKEKGGKETTLNVQESRSDELHGRRRNRRGPLPSPEVDAMSLRSVALVPYAPLPPDSGGKAEMLKHLDVLRELGPCTIASARTKPVGGGWNADTRDFFRARDFQLRFREETRPRRDARQWAGIAYAALCKSLRLERAFGHANPYHRYAFPSAWWQPLTEAADLAVIFYSYWASLPCRCPKILVLMDLWSDYMWGGPRKETRDLATCDRVVVISIEELARLRERGLGTLFWSPPLVPAAEGLPLQSRVALIGSDSPFNREGLRWLAPAARAGGLTVRVYGNLARHAEAHGLESIGCYDDPLRPYRECGIVLLSTGVGMGVQIKTVEALAAGRAIVAREGAARGLPPGNAGTGETAGWISVSTPGQMVMAARHLLQDPRLLRQQALAARNYYRKHLEADRVKGDLAALYAATATTERKRIQHDTPFDPGSRHSECGDHPRAAGNGRSP